VDANGNLYFADGLNEKVVEMAWTGTGYAAPLTLSEATGLHAPHGLAVDANLNLYIADSDDNQIVELPRTTNGFGAEIVLPATNLFYPEAVAVDAAGDVYVANTDAGTVVVLPLSGGSYGTQVALPFTGVQNSNGLAVDASGSVYVADGAKSDVVKVNFSGAPTLTFANTNVGSTSSDSPKNVSVFNIGNLFAYLPIPSSGNNPAYPVDFPINSNASNLCEEDDSIDTGSSCNVSVNFTPTTGGPLSEFVVVTDQNAIGSNITQSIAVSGNGESASLTAQTISFTQPTTPVTYAPGLTVALMATGGGSGNPVVFTIDGSSTGKGSISGNILTITGVGTFVIDANQAGNASYSAAPQVQRTLVVNPAAQVITFTQPTSPVIYSSGLTISLMATGGASGNPVVFTIDSNSTGTATISGSTVTVTGVGNIVIDANQAGNSLYSAAPQVQRTVIVNPATQVINFTQPNSPFAYASGLTIPLVATGGPSGNPVVFTIDASSTGAGSISGSTLTVTKVGNIVVDANQAGNADYSAAPQVQRTFVINAAQQVIVFTQPTSPVTYTAGLTIPLVATGGPSGNPVVFTIDGSSTAKGSISGSTLTVTSVGTFIIDANQAGNTDYTAAAQVQRTIVVNAPIAQAINFVQPTSPVTYAPSLTIALSATGGASDNPVVFTIDATSTATGTISGATLTVTGVGSIVIDANQAGNGTYSAAPQVQRTVVVNQAPQAINFTQPTSPVTFSAGLTITLTATGGASGNAVTFSIDATSTATGTVSGNVITVTGPGNLMIDANQLGNADYLPAPQVQQTVLVNPPPPDFSIAASPASQTIPFGGLANYTVTVKSIGGFGNNVSLSVTGLPSGATGTFTPPQLNPGNGTVTSTLAVQTTTTQLAQSKSNVWPLATPALALLILLPFRRWRRVWSGRLMLLLAGLASLGATAALTGCGGGFALKVSQSYTLTVTGTSGADTHSTTVQLTVQ
jgi:sugar lactone lactonase YvrE